MDHLRVGRIITYVFLPVNRIMLKHFIHYGDGEKNFTKEKP